MTHVGRAYLHAEHTEGRPSPWGSVCRVAHPTFLILALALAAAGGQFRADCDELTKAPHRLSGMAEYEAAADYVAKRLGEIGVDRVVVQEFPSAQTQVKRCVVELGGQSLTLLPMRPDGIVPPVSPPEGIRGKILHAGAGGLDDFGDRSPRDAIVVLDYNCRRGWLRAFRLGAKAVVFVAHGPAESWHAHYTDANANLPRFYYAGRRDELPEGTEAVIHSEVVWDGATGRNVLGLLKGTEPVFDQEKDELVLLAANLDTFGEVPRRSPGARGAANCAALLAIAEHLAKHRPRRHVLFAFFDNQARGHAGSAAFYRAIEKDEATIRLDTRQKYLDNERRFLESMIGLVGRADPLERVDGVERGLGRILARRSRVHEREIAAAVSRLERWRKSRSGARLLAAKEEALARWQSLYTAARHGGDTTATDDEVALVVTEAKGEVEARIREAEAARAALPATGAEREASRLERKLHELRTMLELLARERPLLRVSPVRRELVERLQAKGVGHADRLRTALALLRRERDQEPDDSIRRGFLFGVIKAKAEAKDRWNDLLRALARGSSTAEVADELHTVLTAVRSDIAKRHAELKGERRALETDRAVDELAGKSIIAVHASLLLGDGSPRWGLVIGGDSVLRSYQDNPGLYGKIQGVFLKAHEELKQQGSALPLFETASADGTLDPPRLLWAAPSLIHSGEIAGRLGIYNLALATSQERLPREGTPDDTLASLGLARIEAQVAELGPMLAAVASRKGLSLRRAITPNKLYVFPEFPSGTEPRGPMFIEQVPGSQMGDRPIPGGIVQVLMRARGESPYTDLAYRPRKPYAFDNFILVRTNYNGSYGFGPVRTDVWQMRGFGVSFDERGAQAIASTTSSARSVHYRLNARAGRAGVAVLPPQLRPRPCEVFRARGNSPLDDSRSFSLTLDGVVYWHCEEKVSAVKLFGLHAAVGLVSGGERPRGRQEGVTAQGIGFSMDTVWSPPSITARSAADLWRLNEARMDVLRKRGIVNTSVEELHGRAEDLLLEAHGKTSVSEREALAGSALLAERPVYELTRATLNDLVRAVLVLLALCVPFAFALERLLIGASSIYKQIIWFAGFFTLTFIVLYLSHPAFAIANTPMIIFLGFAVVTLSTLVIVIIMQKFEVELKVLQGLTTTVHAADVSRFSTVMAAMSMGISTMRRRPLRTALTATTIIMLTFTILCFASFGTQTGIVRLFVGASPGHTGVFLHEVNWSELNENLLDVVDARWGRDATLCTRYWVSPRTPQNQGPLVTKADGTKPLALRGVLGLDAVELARRPDLAAVVRVEPEAWDRTVLMTEAVAESVGVKPGDPVLIGGRQLTVGPLLDATALSAVKDMDGNGVLPVDFVEMAGSLGAAASPEEALAAQSDENWAYLPTDSVVVVSSANALHMGAGLHAAMLYTDNAQEATALAEELARAIPLPASATREDGVYRHVLGTLVEASGAGDLVFPILLGGLVIFGTMLGSVADREKEIYTFSSLGLAPPHVASLFFAEAMVYSVLGGLAGYLLAQGTMKVLSVLAGYGLVTVPEMNYSSANAIVTILIVMATVLVSSIYPAVKASRSANPGILRTWRLPQPEGDVFDIVFPFTVSDYDITGVVSFLKEHFENFGDTGLGLFMARDPRLVRDDAGALGIHADLALAPFDLGVTQSFELRSAPSEIAGIDEVTIKLVRRSGQPKDWKRLNKVLLDDLRRQFLIWRALPNETMELYRQRTLEALAAEGEEHEPRRHGEHGEEEESDA